MEFIIDRSTWRCGGDNNDDSSNNEKGLGETALLNREGFMCCLGQVSKQLGATEEMLLEHAEPCDVEKLFDLDENCVLLNEAGLQTLLTIDAMSINDDYGINIKEKEKQLKSLFSEHLIKLKFIGKSVSNKKKSK
tara:strand:- start:3744 stop:4148 length:405 start_codon:yes stop_codon:yes gene_type:complete